MSCRLPSAGARTGFTLIEVLLTSVLAATLLAALWALLSMYLKLFDAGQAKIEQSQLIRTLFAQIETDLAGVVQAPPAVPVVPTLVPAVAAGANSSPASGTGPASSNSDPAAGSGPAGSSAPASSGGSTNRSPAGIGPPIPQMAAKFSRGAGAPAAANTRGIVPPGGVSLSPASDAADRSGARFPAAAKPAPGVTSTTSLRPGGVFGTETSLRIDVMQAAIAPDEMAFDEQRAPGELGPSRVPELMTIVYVFEETHEPGQPLSEPTMLLVRREMAWEDSHPAHRGGRAAGGQGSVTTQDSNDIADRRGLASGISDETDLLDPLAATTESDTTATIPEVSQFGIRYFDGTTWSLEWNSVQRKALPVAIEISLELKPVSEQGAVPSTADVATTDVTAPPPVVPVHRLLVHLPGGQPASPAEIDSQRGLQSPLLNAEPQWKGNAYGSSR